MQNMNVLLKKTPVNEMTNHILPMINQSLEADNSQLQVLLVEYFFILWYMIICMQYLYTVNTGS